MSAEGDGASADQRLRRIQSIIDSDLVYLEMDELLVELLTRVRDALEADTATVLLLDSSARQLVATAAIGLEEEVRLGVSIPVGRGFAGRVAAERRPVIVDHVDASTVVNPILLEKGIRSLMGVPLLAGGNLLGVLHVGSLTPRTFADDDQQLLQVAADRIALATQARLSSAERAAAQALQRSLLPMRFPEFPGLEFAARYLPSKGHGMGGDWYDVFPLPSGDAAIAIGDAMGHGLRAAVVMSRLRSTLRAYAIETDSPADALTRLDRKLQYFEPEELATVLYGIFDPSSERLCLSSAGHLAPVLATAEGGVSLLDVAPDPPLGAPTGGLPRQETVVELQAGATLLCFTDGLVERRGVSLESQLDRLTASTATGPPDVLCMALTNRMFRDDPPEDDVAILAVRRRTATEPGAPNALSVRRLLPAAASTSWTGP